MTHGSLARLAMIAVLAAAACTPAEEDTGEAMDTAEMATDESAAAEVAQVRDQWIAAAERDDAAAVAALYTMDAVMVGTDGEVYRGAAEIEPVLARDFPMASDLTVTSSNLHASGDLAVDVGRFQQTVTPPDGEPMTVSGSYAVVLRRQPDGSWKIIHHLSAVPPAESMMPPVTTPGPEGEGPH